MKKLQIALLGIVSVGLMPSAMNAQDRCDRDRGDNYGYSQYPAYPPNYPSGPAYYDRYDRRYSQRDRSAAIISGSTMAGAIIGGAAGQGRGAAIGAMIGGVTGLIIDQATRDHYYRHDRDDHYNRDYRREREYR